MHSSTRSQAHATPPLVLPSTNSTRQSLQLQQEQHQELLSPMKQVAAATAGGVVTALFVTPFDVVKTRLQAQIGVPPVVQAQAVQYAPVPCHEQPLRGTLVRILKLSSQNKALNSNSYTSRLLIHTSQDAFVKISKCEGNLALWRGLGPAIALTVPATALYFTSYERTKVQLQRLGIVPPSLTPALSGLVARAITVAVTCPLELVRTNVQSHPKTSAKEVISRITKTKGFFSLWTGLSPTLLRDVPFSIIYWSALEFVKVRLIHQQQRLAQRRNNKNNFSSNNNNTLSIPFLDTPFTYPIFTINFLSGLAGGVVAAAATTPIDVIKTRMQMHHTRDYPASITAIVQRVAQEEGYGAFFKGLAPRIVKVAPACAIMISSYEVFKGFFAPPPPFALTPTTTNTTINTNNTTSNTNNTTA
eukprot:TRINITY_DN4427_c0_g1_i2.p1 TRINITY_DN4427_c0_g1~~TRINITY_DN4427_c0_g1_i2.p1  ORF type:complete len:417 (-),score=83.76 TRINITY_DN4427_c0_g1_i2:183-1433(-)